MTEAKVKKEAARLKAEEIGPAIWLDYEGSKGRAPTLLGYRVAGQDGSLRYRAYLVEAQFASCADPGSQVRPIEVRDRLDAVTELLRRAEREGRVLVSWSGHDKRLMQEALEGNGEFLALLDRWWRDARIGAKRWRRTAFPELVGGPHSQARYAELLGIPVPEKFGSGKVGKGLRKIRDQLAEGRDFAGLTPGARKSWHAIVRHNQYDLEVMEQISKAVVSPRHSARTNNREVP